MKRGGRERGGGGGGRWWYPGQRKPSLLRIRKGVAGTMRMEVCRKERLVGRRRNRKRGMPATGLGTMLQSLTIPYCQRVTG